MAVRRFIAIVAPFALAAAAISLTQADNPQPRPPPLDCTGPSGVNAEAAQQGQRDWATYLGRPINDTIDLGGGVKLEVVLIPAGKFTMGSPAPEQGYVTKICYAGKRPDWLDGESPQHQVMISRPFYLGAYTVTVGQFRRFVDDTGYKTEAERTGEGSYVFDGKKWEINKDSNWRRPGFQQTDEHPVTCVSWNDAVNFCEWLSRRDGHDFRLPTEAEWEYSCRGGRPSSDPFGVGDGASLTASRANFNGNFPYESASKGRYLERTCPVGSYRPNALGLYDMHGNVWQWCSDWHGNYPSGYVTNPTGPRTGRSRVFRGGSWIGAAYHCRAAHRGWIAPSDRRTNEGFRIARVPSDLGK